jgi:Amt family ammonium transporter
MLWCHNLIPMPQIDDPVSAFALHGGVGIFGVLFPGLLARPEYVEEVYGSTNWGATAKEGKR